MEKTAFFTKPLLTFAFISQEGLIFAYSMLSGGEGEVGLLFPLTSFLVFHLFCTISIIIPLKLFNPIKRLVQDYPDL